MRSTMRHAWYWPSNSCLCMSWFGVALHMTEKGLLSSSTILVGRVVECVQSASKNRFCRHMLSRFSTNRMVHPVTQLSQPSSGSRTIKSPFSPILCAHPMSPPLSPSGMSSRSASVPDNQGQ
ncbi:unnamed protein product [Mycena citricolor]|uniref:Secreted protein n=1 Tax=Mycena citricolor TaxID=2018698 RepID=A0AAD2HEG3_9AGAR|nr:unnamed protein product [Mycena citricolor]